MIATSEADQAFSRFAVSIACAVYLVGYAGYSFGETLGTLRYLVYAVPPILVASFMLQRTSASNKPAVVLFVAYLSLGCLSYLSGVKNTDFFLSNFLIIALIIVSFVPTINVSAQQIRVVFLCSLAYMVLAYLLTEHGGIRLFQILERGTGSGLGTGYDNHQGGLLGPIYAVFLYAIGDKLQFLLALVMSVLGGKRVGVIAILVGLGALFLFNRVTALHEKRHRFIVLLAALAAVNIAASNMIAISEYAYRSLGISVHIEEVMLGRHAIGTEMARVMDGRSFVESLVGFGPGSADALANIVSDGVLTQPHNDWLKILYDYGILGSIAVTVFIAIVFSTSTTGAVIAITSAIIMTTDNVVIYLYYQFPIILMVAYSALWESRVSKTVNAREVNLIEAGQAATSS
jgi:hypothetical protein